MYQFLIPIQKEHIMRANNKISSAATKVTMIQRAKNRRANLPSDRTKAVTSIIHETENFLQPSTSTQKVEVPVFMNSYRLESRNRFNCAKVHEVLAEIVEKHCFGVKYDPVKSAATVQTIAQEILHRVKQFDFDRYRLIVYIVIGTNNKQEFEAAVKFLWDASTDRFTTYTLKSGLMFISATCFGIYYD